MANPRAKPAVRKRAWEDTCDALLAVCMSYIAIPTKIGPYGPRVDKNLLCRHKKFLHQLQGVQSNLAFTKLRMKAVLTELATSKSEEWEFSQTDIDTFSTDITNRVRLMCRHLSQAQMAQWMWL